MKNDIICIYITPNLGILITIWRLYVLYLPPTFKLNADLSHSFNYSPTKYFNFSITKETLKLWCFILWSNNRFQASLNLAVQYNRKQNIWEKDCFKLLPIILHACTNRSNLKMEPKYLTKWRSAKSKYLEKKKW